MKPLTFSSVALTLLIALPTLASGSTSSQEARQVEKSTQESARAIQKQVEDLDAQRQADFQAWRQVRRETLVLQAHNRRLAEWNSNLTAQIDKLEKQLKSLDTTREELEPLMQLMLTRLEGFIRHDLPFRKKERLQKVSDLQELLPRVDVSHAEKLRQLLATYRSEVSQGRQLSRHREFIQVAVDREEERVSLLRLGRIGLYYLSEDQERAGVWQAAEEKWLPLTSRQRAEVAKGLELADERGLPELLSLPLSIPLRQAEEEKS
ncbi:DUF3450 domain-containing protein [Marinospirillum sp.]|uniref:DUF3450 domain-containing protein n=1 Tax=Marinospirillum sp. TaxID=2183934 RepID=UPI0038516CA6